MPRRRGVAPPAADERGRAARQARRSPRAAFHRAAAALLRGAPGQALEELGIGRPSTYASILTVLQDRDYVRMDKQPARPGGQGPPRHRLPRKLLRAATSNTTSPPTSRRSSTRSRPASSTGRSCCATSGRDFSGAVGETKDLRDQPRCSTRSTRCWGRTSFRRRADGADPRRCPACGNGRLSLKLGKFGAFIGCSNYPECRYTRPLAVPRRRRRRRQARGTARSARDPETGARRSRCATAASGPMCSSASGRGREAEARQHPQGHGSRRRSISRRRSSCCRCRARSAGIPEDGEPIMAGIGRYGPYVQHGRTYANLETAEDVFTIGLNRAVTLLAEKAPRARPRPLRRRSRPRARRASRQGGAVAV